ncbi:MAG: YdcF family protein [Pseudaminobacter sp.]|nr:YdcF family protein [Pseudaminobacter sp.]
MFFFISKVFAFFIHPVNFSILVLAAGLFASHFGWRRTSGALAFAAFMVLGISAWTPLGAAMLNPLEERFARPAYLPEKIAGIVVLGGGFEGAINLARGGYELNSSGDRFVEAAILARRHPEARIVVSGGAGTLLLEGEGDSDTALRLLTALGVAPERLILENQARNTHENAVYTRQLVTPKPSETWLLVTSAFHMPRSMALFKKVNFPVLPWPVDYRTPGKASFALMRDNPIDSLQNTTLATREWIGLFAYWLSGRIDSPFP